MKSLLALCLIFCLCLDARGGEHKYGFLAANDDDLIKVMRRVDAVILGRIDQDVKAGGGWDLHVTVIECFKGSLKPGDSVFIAIVAEGGPDPKEEIGRQRFFFLVPNSHVVPDVAGSFWCDWTDNKDYEQFGEPMRKLLRSAPQREITWLDELLAVSEDREIDDPEKDRTFPGISSGVSMGWSHPLLSMRWVSRAELLARKRHWEQCLASHTVNTGTTQGELYEGFVFTDFSVCEYKQAVPPFDFGEDKRQSAYAEPMERPAWQYWVPPEKGSELYKLFTDFPKAAQTKPDETSWCVMMKYFDNGKCHVKHFYVPSRLEIQTLLHEVQEAGQDCSTWKQSDKRLWTIPEWMARDFKYDVGIWYKN
jgi:hypothetical protein